MTVDCGVLMEPVGLRLNALRVGGASSNEAVGLRENALKVGGAAGSSKLGGGAFATESLPAVERGAGSRKDDDTIDIERVRSAL